MIAITKTDTNSETLETVADPDHIVDVDFDGMADGAIRLVCPNSPLKTSVHSKLYS